MDKEQNENKKDKDNFIKPLVNRPESSLSYIRFKFHRVSIDSGFAQKCPEIVKRLTLFQLIFAICGLISGMACIILGVVLFFHDITGSTSWTAKIIGSESEISDAAPGVILFIVGLFLILITRFSVKIKS